MFPIKIATLINFGYTVYPCSDTPGSDWDSQVLDAEGQLGQEGRVVTSNRAAGQEHVLRVQRQLPHKRRRVHFCAARSHVKSNQA